LPYTKEIILILSSYVLGCFTTGYYLVRLRTGKDIRNLGSGNVGARNIGRVIGKFGLVITLLGDAGKGAVVAFVASYFGLEAWGVMLAIIAVVVGHIWPVQLGLRGGKGVATSLGALVVFDWQLVAVLIMVTGLAFALMRRFTLSGLIAVLLAPVASLAVGQPLIVMLEVSALAAIVLVAHRMDIRHILRPTHERPGKRQTKLPDQGQSHS
jgi:glycerol-3-phosphate acyltransferase PlsY